MSDALGPTTGAAGEGIDPAEMIQSAAVVADRIAACVERIAAADTAKVVLEAYVEAMQAVVALAKQKLSAI